MKRKVMRCSVVCFQNAAGMWGAEARVVDSDGTIKREAFVGSTRDEAFTRAMKWLELRQEKAP